MSRFWSWVERFWKYFIASSRVFIFRLPYCLFNLQMQLGTVIVVSVLDSPVELCPSVKMLWLSSKCLANAIFEFWYVSFPIIFVHTFADVMHSAWNCSLFVHAPYSYNLWLPRGFLDSIHLRCCMYTGFGCQFDRHANRFAHFLIQNWSKLFLF